jgi:hypothetical protein
MVNCNHLIMEALAKVLKLKCSRKLEFACFLCFQYVTKRRLKPAATELDFCKSLHV